MSGSILVVLPTLGQRLDSLRETLLSVDLQRQDVDLTLVVVVPSSAVDARALALDNSAVVIDDPHQGLSHAINLAIGAASDELYYAWIGDDDLFQSAALRTLQDLIEVDPQT